MMKKEVLYTSKNRRIESKIVLINHIQNGGVGAAIASGYKW